MKKKKILLLADDLRMHSGIACMSRELVLGTCHHYDFVQIAGSVKHPDKGKVFDLSDAAKNERGVKDAYIKLYPTDGYGNPQILQEVMNIEKPDAILHFTDPRFWMWLYQMERDIRKSIPITYLNIWDDTPFPMWNRPFYKSCDLLMSISKQTLNINKHVLGDNHWVLADDVNDANDVGEKAILHYVPHGIDTNTFKPLPNDDSMLLNVKQRVLRNKNYEYVLFFNNRNIQRKRTGNIILAYRMFCDSLTKEQAQKCCLLLHTQPIDDNGTDLTAVAEALCPDYDIVFSTDKLDPKQMNCLYNIADVTVNVASNEGFGLSHAESLVTGTPIINNVTGGLQDGCGFRDENGNLVEFTANWGSNHDGKYKSHGKWVKPVYPATRNLQGSPPTPYIFDDLCRWEDIAEAMMFWYLAGDEKRKECGEAGKEFALGEGGLNSDNMSKQLIFAMDKTLQTFTPRSRVSLHTSDEYVGHKMPTGMGFEIPKLDIEKIKKDVEFI
jgi:glycosyltransferase involved in cell wall biosynthesis